ncbi:PTS system ascorbate-specific IIA component [Erwinia persicina]|uniref:PTS sugar transporter subunit IIA n=1 Tax=Erwinia persicina TaxID=55211 RepID=UPI0020A039C6|nr:PTS sugar transporter subunit IIA [Erwinia persicina]MCP1438874.1 PTS system ascorbate-specific IIA component [Erwinia persicina]
MLSNWLQPENIQLTESVGHWQEAIRQAAAPLLAQQAITPDYLEAIFRSHAKLGPYYVLAPGLAMPHARPEEGALKNGLSLLRINQGVSFDSAENDPVYVVILLSAVSGEEHIRMIGELAGLFSDDFRLQQLLSATTLSALTAAVSDPSLEKTS